MAADNAALSPSLSPLFPHTPGNLRLVYITSLIVVGVVGLFLLHVLGSLRRRSSHKVLHVVVLGAYTLSYALASYTLGLMQESTDYFGEFPVWAVCLLMLLGGTDNLMACKLDDVDNWKTFHVRHLLKGALVVYIVAAYTNHAPEYRMPLWAILSVNILQSCMRINSMKMASKSNLHAKSVKPIIDHMKGDDQKQRFDPVTLEGYKYIVSGEHGLIPKKTSGEQPAEETKITTVENIWQCKGKLFCRKRGMKLKDICLSMALSKMLNRRFAGFKLAEAGLGKTHDFVFKGLLVGDKACERTFRVIEIELGFVYDLYYTRYPYLYNKVRHLALGLPVAMVIFCSWLTYVIFQKHKVADSIPLCTTVYLMSVVTFLEAFQLYLHVASDWFKVALIRSYVTRPAWQGSLIWSKIISLALRLKAFQTWENKLGQYCLLRSYDGTRRRSNFIHYVTLWLVDRAKKGCKRGKLVKLSTHVKEAVIASLVRSKDDLKNGVSRLPRIPTQLSWAYDARDGTVTHTILVWHIATTICKHEIDVAVSVIDSDVVNTASSLSQYCAYLVAFAPDLLPDHSFDSASVLDKSIEDARSCLQGAKTMKEKCEKLKGLSISHINIDEPPPPVLVVEGALLARLLTKKIQDGSLRWKVLSDFWADMMLYIAPCDDAKARAHLEALPRGGEFITHLWALLTHAGVLKNEPMPKSEPSEPMPNSEPSEPMPKSEPTGLDAV